MIVKVVRKIVEKLCIRGYFSFIDDQKYLKIAFWAKIGARLNLKEPKTFSEKLQWLKLHDRKDIYTLMVDKYEAKKYISDKIGEQYVVKNYGIWNSFDEIDFDVLPDSFVLKCTHDSGGLVICPSKEKLDYTMANEKISRSLNRDFYAVWREWPYKNVKPRIIAEEYLGRTEDLPDYKIHCFNGEPRFILVCSNRFSAGGMNEDFISLDWKRMEVRRPNHSNSGVLPEKPEELDEMLALSRIVAKNIPFLRVDFYVVNHKVYLGELTFFPGSGLIPFEPEEYDSYFGDMIIL